MDFSSAWPPAERLFLSILGVVGRLTGTRERLLAIEVMLFPVVIWMGEGGILVSAGPFGPLSTPALQLVYLPQLLVNT